MTTGVPLVTPAPGAALSDKLVTPWRGRHPDPVAGSMPSRSESSPDRPMIMRGDEALGIVAMRGVACRSSVRGMMFWSHAEPLFYPRGFQPYTVRLREADRLRRQIQEIAAFSLVASNERDQQTLLDQACRTASDGLVAPSVKMMVYQPREQVFLLRSAVERAQTFAHITTIANDPTTAVGRSWRDRCAIVVQRASDNGCLPSPLTAALGGRVCVPVLAEDDADYGVMDIDYDDNFSREDLLFLQVVTQVLGQAIARTATYRQSGSLLPTSNPSHEVSKSQQIATTKREQIVRR